MDLKSMTVRALRELARKTIGPGYSRLKTKTELITALGKVLPKAALSAVKAAGKPKRPRIKGIAPGKEAPAGPGPKLEPIVEGGRQATAADAETFFTARIAPEGRSREPASPRMAGAAPPPPAAPSVGWDEELGELPDTYEDDSVIALPRDPTTLFVYWDLAPSTVRSASDGLPGPRAILRILAGNESLRQADVALESRCHYAHGLPSGRAYRAELYFVGSDGRERRIALPSREVWLPNAGPSSVIDDRFVSIPWDLPLSKLQGLWAQGRSLGEFAQALRERIYTLSGGRFGRPAGGGLSGGAPTKRPGWSGAP